ncbi:hypothetical protein QN344_08165, partial [Mucilaginibacter sp. 5B2]|nr:hypothetical protein [Mucilaginibacter sp. 5B2]
MALSNITFQQGAGGLGRPLAGQDFYTSLVFYSSALPSGFSTANHIKKFLSPQDAINSGISYSYADETQATGSYLVTAIGAVGDTVVVSVTELNAKTVILGSYTKVAGDTTPTILATKIAAAINANTIANGYTASSTTATVTITARKGLGVFLNTGTPLVVQAGGTIAGTLTAFSGGVPSRNAVYFYHISEFFRIQPKGVLYVGIFAVPSTYTFAEISTVQSFATGTLRQWGVWKDASAFSTADLTSIDIQNKLLDTAHSPLVGLYAADLSGTTDIST